MDLLMNKAKGSLLIGLLIIIVAGAFNLGMAETFQRRPITEGLYGATAHTLAAGE